MSVVFSNTIHLLRKHLQLPDIPISKFPLRSIYFEEYFNIFQMGWRCIFKV